MCEFMSGYQDKLGNIYDGEGFTDSHSEIALIHGLRDSDVDYYAQNLAKWECTPPVDTTQWKDFSKWKIIADENEAPVWFDVEKIRTHVAKVVGSWFITDKRGVLLGGCYIFDGKESSVKSVIRGRVLAVVNGADLYGADLYGADLSRAYLSGANLSGADLSGAYLSRAYLSRATVDLPAGWKLENGICTKE